MDKNNLKTRKIIVGSIVILVLIVTAVILGLYAGSTGDDKDLDSNTSTMVVKEKDGEAVEKEKEYSKEEKIIVDELNKLKSGDKETIKRWFGDGETFTKENVADRTMATVVTFMYNSNKEADGEEKTGEAVHICTLNYTAMQEASDKLKEQYKNSNVSMSDEDLIEISKIDLAEMTADGMFDAHYTIKVQVDGGKVIVTDELKQAITGNWYKGVGVELKNVECPLSETKVVDKVIIEK